MNLANKITIFRLLLTPVFVLSILYYRSDSPIFSNLPFVIFAAAVMSDALDGYVARRFGQVTRLGTAIDPLADKLLLIVSFITLSLTEILPPFVRIPPWVLIIVLTRDIFIVIGVAIIYMVFEYIEFKPTALGKYTTFFQMATIISCLLRFRFSYIIWDTAALLTVLSGIQYLSRANRVLHERIKNHF